MLHAHEPLPITRGATGTLKELGVASQCVAEDAAISLLRVAACSPSVRSLDLRGVKLYDKVRVDPARKCPHLYTCRRE
jgi:hypothetical protein